LKLVQQIFQLGELKGLLLEKVRRRIQLLLKPYPHLI
jgi:hypothetical protein